MELTDDVLARLHREALTAQRRAYAPYSNFSVGAALLTDRGRIVTGCNVENASYGLTICAERNAIFRTVVQAEGRPLVCVVAGPRPEPLTPCGACRQVLLEFNPEMDVIAFGSTGEHRRFTMAQLLPHSFGVSDLA